MSAYLGSSGSASGGGFEYIGSYLPGTVWSTFYSALTSKQYAGYMIEISCIYNQTHYSSQFMSLSLLNAMNSGANSSIKLDIFAGNSTLFQAQKSAYNNLPEAWNISPEPLSCKIWGIA